MITEEISVDNMDAIVAIVNELNDKCEIETEGPFGHGIPRPFDVSTDGRDIKVTFLGSDLWSTMDEGDIQEGQNLQDYLMKEAAEEIFNLNQFFRPTVMPKVVCLCGSTRFMDAFQKANLDETLAGNIVLSVGCNTKSDNELEITDEVKGKLDELHKRKIDMADEVFVLNVGGYVGSSTKSEIDYAEQRGKVIRYLESGL